MPILYLNGRSGFAVAQLAYRTGAKPSALCGGLIWGIRQTTKIKKWRFIPWEKVQRYSSHGYFTRVTGRWKYILPNLRANYFAAVFLVDREKDPHSFPITPGTFSDLYHILQYSGTLCLDLLRTRDLNRETLQDMLVRANFPSEGIHISVGADRIRITATKPAPIVTEPKEE